MGFTLKEIKYQIVGLFRGMIQKMVCFIGIQIKLIVLCELYKYLYFIYFLNKLLQTSKKHLDARAQLLQPS
jgi:hypothetical protein